MHAKRMTNKNCPKCETTKNVNEFGRDSSRLDGRYTYCKACRLTPVSAAEAEIVRLAEKGQKNCTKCNKVKPFVAFDSDSTKRFGFASGCKKCQRERRKKRSNEWHTKQEELNELYVSGKSKCTKCGSVKRLREFLSSRRAKLGIYRLCKECNNSYRSRRKPSNRDYTNWEVFEDDNFTCYICEDILDPSVKHPDPKSLSIEHVVPISLNGSDTRENVRTACLSCNLDKRDKPLDIYLLGRTS